MNRGGSEGNPDVLERFSQRLLRACRIDQSAYGGDAIGRNAHSLGVFLDDCLVRGEINAVHLIASYVAVKPLDLATHSLQNVDRLLGDFPLPGLRVQ